MSSKWFKLFVSQTVNRTVNKLVSCSGRLPSFLQEFVAVLTWGQVSGSLSPFPGIHHETILQGGGLLETSAPYHVLTSRSRLPGHQCVARTNVLIVTGRFPSNNCYGETDVAERVRSARARRRWSSIDARRTSTVLLLSIVESLRVIPEPVVAQRSR